jgi:hypothetical protein
MRLQVLFFIVLLLVQAVTNAEARKDKDKKKKRKKDKKKDKYDKKEGKNAEGENRCQLKLYWEQGYEWQEGETRLLSVANFLSNGSSSVAPPTQSSPISSAHSIQKRLKENGASAQVRVAPPDWKNAVPNRRRNGFLRMVPFARPPIRASV